MDHEWVRRADDALWRRTKQGMWLNAEQQSRVSQWLVEYTQQVVAGFVRMMPGCEVQPGYLDS